MRGRLYTVYTVYTVDSMDMVPVGTNYICSVLVA